MATVAGRRCVVAPVSPLSRLRAGDPRAPRGEARRRIPHEWWEEGRRAHPELPLELAEFARAFPRFGDGEALGPAAPAADLYIAVACDAGVPGAWRVLEMFQPVLHAVLRRRGANAREVAEVLEDLPGFLCEAPPDGRARTRMGTYAGRSRLGTWLAAVALHRLHKVRFRRETPLSPRDGDRVPSREAPIDSRMHREEATPALARALGEGWARLSPREREAVLLRYRDGVDQRRIALALGVGEPRVSRLIRAGVAKLRDAVLRRFPSGCPLAVADDGTLRHSLAEVVRSRLAEATTPSC